MTNKKENTQRVLDNHGNVTQNGDIIIENTNNISKSLKNYKQKIPAKNISFIQMQKNFLFFIMIFIFCYVLINQIFFKLDFEQFFITLFSFLISFGFIFFIFSVYTDKKHEVHIIIDIDKLIFYNNDSKKKEIAYNNIRSSSKTKNITIFGIEYIFYIYTENELKPKVKFSTSSVHTIIAIEELINNKIKLVKEENS